MFLTILVKYTEYADIDTGEWIMVQRCNENVLLTVWYFCTFFAHVQCPSVQTLFVNRPFSRQTLWLVIVGTNDINDGSVLFKCPSRSDSQPACRYQNPETEAANWHLTIIHLLFTSVFFLLWHVKVYSGEKGCTCHNHPVQQLSPALPTLLSHMISTCLHTCLSFPLISQFHWQSGRGLVFCLINISLFTGCCFELMQHLHELWQGLIYMALLGPGHINWNKISKTDCIDAWHPHRSKNQSPVTTCDQISLPSSNMC